MIDPDIRKAMEKRAEKARAFPDMSKAKPRPQWHASAPVAEEHALRPFRERMKRAGIGDEGGTLTTLEMLERLIAERDRHRHKAGDSYPAPAPHIGPPWVVTCDSENT